MTCSQDPTQPRGTRVAAEFCSPLSRPAPSPHPVIVNSSLIFLDFTTTSNQATGSFAFHNSEWQRLDNNPLPCAALLAGVPGGLCDSVVASDALFFLPRLQASLAPPLASPLLLSQTGPLTCSTRSGHRYRYDLLLIVCDTYY